MERGGLEGEEKDCGKQEEESMEGRRIRRLVMAIKFYECTKSVFPDENVCCQTSIFCQCLKSTTIEEN
jgi:hypothetical protein